MNRRDALKNLGALGVTAYSAGFGGTTAQAAGYPAQSVRVLIGVAPGGVTDYMGRLFTQYMTKSMDQSFIAENRGGASGTLAASMVARAPADGYTLLATTPTVMVVAPYMYKQLTFDPNKDFVPVCLIGAGPTLLVVNAKLPVKNVTDLIALARAKPDTLTFASGGPGSNGHLTGELFASTAGVKLVHVPFKGDGEGAINVIGGQVDMMFSVMSVLEPHIKSGRLRALGVANSTRMTSAPEIPTLAEAGLPGVTSLAWVAIYAPKSTPSEVVKVLNAKWQVARMLPEVKRQLASVAMDQLDLSTPAQLAAYQKTETVRWGNVIRTAGIKPS
jgi:tripartite-type tricarboxylate transporter receptor subunit TctC